MVFDTLELEQLEARARRREYSGQLGCRLGRFLALADARRKRRLPLFGLLLLR